ncbi:MAG: elongation factor P maturation arginine rhamnosyltransferase EarP [Rhodocyclaceae bacterium]|nr:elongation factor P maturation arginine rhamnosyltransferase EarP [Rhodocyclaceae bacterium]
MKWDIFCSVVDNYGDIGVCWRLARQLAAEYGFEVRLMCDDLQVFARICPRLDATAACQRAGGVEIRRWDGELHVAPAQVVLESFGCRLPEVYVEAMGRASAAPLWINFEYLSAENWVERCHGLPSRHGHLPLVTWFFYPGFTAATGGLLREAHLLRERDAFLADREVQVQYWRSLGLAPAARNLSLFCYGGAPLDAWLAELAAAPQPLRLIVPEGVANAELARWGLAVQAGSSVQHGGLSLVRIGLQDQPGYDRLLWACDMNVVRGEDSFLRALWAGRPFCWHIYPQQDGAHAAKLEAFLGRYLGEAGEGLARAAAVAFMRAWNGLDGAPDIAAAWRALQAQPAECAQFAAARAQHFAGGTDAAAGLVKFVREKLQ